MIQVLFVCMGNICRSPTAEIVFAKHVKDANLEHKILCDSAGTHAYHVGHAPDERSREAVKKRGLDMSHLIARQVTINDFKEYDYIVAMDKANLESLKALAPKSHIEKVSLLLAHAPELNVLEVPDPYYGIDDGFEHVYKLVEQGTLKLLQRIISERLK